MKDGVTVSFQSFTDVIVFPDKERTDFKGGGGRSIQTNVGIRAGPSTTKPKSSKCRRKADPGFKHGIRTSLDNLLRGKWRNEAKLTYIGKRPATLGRRNDVVRLIYDDGLAVEFEFSADEGFPLSPYTRERQPTAKSSKKKTATPSSWTSAAYALRSSRPLY
jgi:hypothetical protein